MQLQALNIAPQSIESCDLQGSEAIHGSFGAFGVAALLDRRMLGLKAVASLPSSPGVCEQVAPHLLTNGTM